MNNSRTSTGPPSCGLRLQLVGSVAPRRVTFATRILSSLLCRLAAQSASKAMAATVPLFPLSIYKLKHNGASLAIVLTPELPRKKKISVIGCRSRAGRSRHSFHPPAFRPRKQTGIRCHLDISQENTKYKKKRKASGNSTHHQNRPADSVIYPDLLPISSHPSLTNSSVPKHSPFPNGKVHPYSISCFCPWYCPS